MTKKYVDGFVIAIKKSKLKDYKKDATLGYKTWMKYGALDYYECIGDDLNIKFGKPFTKLLGLKKDETAIFSFITYKSKKHRNEVNHKVMTDPAMDPSNLSRKEWPFDMNRFSMGGFNVLDLGPTSKKKSTKKPPAKKKAVTRKARSGRK